MMRDRMQSALDAAWRRALDVLAIAVLLCGAAAFLVNTWPVGAQALLIVAVFMLAVCRCVVMVFRGRT